MHIVLKFTHTQTHARTSPFPLCTLRRHCLLSYFHLLTVLPQSKSKLQRLGIISTTVCPDL